jgi:hypothetical protein
MHKEGLAMKTRNRMLWGTGLVEFWNDGFGGVRSIFFVDSADQKLKSGPDPVIIPNIPFFHHSIFPLAIKVIPPLRGEIKSWSYRPGYFTKRK